MSRVNPGEARVIRNRLIAEQPGGRAARQRQKPRQPTGSFVAWLGRGARSIAEFATRRVRPVTPRSVENSRRQWEGGGPVVQKGEGGFARKERERREGLRRGQRAATDTAAGDYVACRRGTVSSYPRRLPRSDWPGSLPRKRTGFSFVSTHLRTSLGTLSSVSSLSLARSSQLYVILAAADCSSLSNSRHAGIPSPSVPHGFHLAVLRRSTMFRLCLPFCSFRISLSLFRKGPRRLPALVRLLNAASGGSALPERDDHSFRNPTNLSVAIERRWTMRNCRKNRLPKEYI